MNQMNEWKAKQAEKEKANIVVKPIAKPVTKVEDSYTSDDFDDVSISGSGSSKLPSKPATTS